MSDRAMWSESARRLIISEFTRNRVVSLPQTIYFSDTDIGRLERSNTCQIYAQHPDLTIIARDRKSSEIALGLFPDARRLCIPDFVLSLSGSVSVAGKQQLPRRILLCFRRDQESVLDESDKRAISDGVKYPSTHFDTTLDQLIHKAQRRVVLSETLELFHSHSVVVTDRLHGVIFSVITRTPCIALRTVDHKLTESIAWFREMPFIMMADDLRDIPALIEKGLRMDDFPEIDWNALYFDKLVDDLELREARLVG